MSSGKIASLQALHISSNDHVEQIQKQELLTSRFYTKFSNLIARYLCL